MNEIHNLKILPEYFKDVKNGNKTFEIRANDRDFKVNDIVLLREWNMKKEEYTGNYMYVRITYITDFQQKQRWIVFGFKDVTENWEETAKMKNRITITRMSRKEVEQAIIDNKKRGYVQCTEIKKKR